MAQTPTPDAAAAETRPTGLPPRVDWTFNFDATWGSFGFANSLFINPKEGVDENLSDQWFEGSIKPALSGQYRFAGSSELYGKVSAVGERTYGSAPDLVGSDFSSFQVEDLSIGWRSGKTLEGLGENAIDLHGRPHTVPARRTAFCSSTARPKAAAAAATGPTPERRSSSRRSDRSNRARHKIDGFYLDRDELPESESGTRLWGTNYELRLGEHSTFGATYLKFLADSESSPERDDLNVFNVRAYTAPIPPGSRSGARGRVRLRAQRRAAALGCVDAAGVVRAQQGDLDADVHVPLRLLPGRRSRHGSQNEAFDPLLPGFYDWGTWWQGEIAGEYFLSNSNLKSHLIRAHVTPSESVERRRDVL